MNRELKTRNSHAGLAIWVLAIAYSLFFIPDCFAAAPLRSPAAPPDAIHAMYDAGKYRQVLRKTAIVVNLAMPTNSAMTCTTCGSSRPIAPSPSAADAIGRGV